MRVFERKGRKGSTWYIDFTFKGRRIMEAVGSDRKLAEAGAKKRENEIFEGKFFPQKRKSKFKFKELSVEYMEKHSRRNKRSWRRDEVGLKSPLPYFGDIYLDDITPKMIEDYRGLRGEQGRSPATVNREHALLKNMFTKAVHWDYTRQNPAKKVPLAKESRRIRFLSKEEIKRLLEAADTEWAPYLKLIIILALNTAMRRGEILRLKWEEVDFKRRVIQVKQTKNYQPREVPMTDWLFETVWAWRKKSLDNCYVFGNNTMQPMISFRTAFEKALKRAGIEDFRFHDLRHTAASYLHMAGVDIKDMKEIGDWKTLRMVDRYTHISTEHKRATMLLLKSEIRPLIETNSKQMDSALS
jgi:integrase